MFFTSSQPSPSQPKALALTAASARSPGLVAGAKPECCGWFDSSFDLATGLEVTEQDCDTLYQLWDLSHR